jgi:hypothetical protein
MKRNVKLALFIVLLLIGTSAAVADAARIPVGTSIHVRVTDKLDSETASVGRVTDTGFQHYAMLSFS